MENLEIDEQCYTNTDKHDLPKEYENKLESACKRLEEYEIENQSESINDSEENIVTKDASKQSKEDITNIQNEVIDDTTDPNTIKDITVNYTIKSATNEGVTEAGRFSMASICALALNYLFNEDFNATFCKKCMRSIVNHLQLPHRVESTMYQFIKSKQPQSVEPYVELLRTEPFFIHNNGSLQPIVHDLIALAVHDGTYDGRWRVMIQYVSCQFGINAAVVDEFESKLIMCLLNHATEQTQEEKNDEKSRNFIRRTKRFAMIGLATIGGGALIGMTGGLAAPLIGAGLTSVIGTSAIFTAISSAAGAAIVGSLFGVAGGGLTGYKMHKRVGDIEEFEFHLLNPLLDKTLPTVKRETNLNTVKELHITIAISGWIKEITEDNFTKPWISLSNGREQYYLRYESNYLLELGQALNYIVTFVASAAAQETLKLTVLSGLVSAIAWPAGLIGLASVIDNPWGVCLRRSAQVGKQLAEILLARDHGHRPVTLVGYSLGARVIFYCLREMSYRKHCEGIIQDVILIGAPCTGNIDDWKKFTRVVSGRIVNGYCRGDWLLKFLYRTLSVAVDVAGLQPIKLNDRRMYNVDLTDLVSGHSEYPEKMTEILSYIDGTVVKSDAFKT